MATEESNHGNLERLFENISGYIDSKIDGLRLRAVLKTSDLVSSLISRLVVICFLLMFFIMLSFAGALWLGEILGKTSLGFLCMAGLYVVAIILISIFRRTFIKGPVSSAIIKKAIS